MTDGSATSVPTENAVKTYVAAIKTDCANIETAIDNASDMAAFKKLYDWEYNTDDCTHIVNINIPDDILIKLTKEAHKRDITLNHLMNEILHDSIQRNIL